MMLRFKAEYAVKYRKENHPANEWFEIDAADAEEMRRYGVVEKPTTPAPKETAAAEKPKRRKTKA